MSYYTHALTPCWSVASMWPQLNADVRRADLQSGKMHMLMWIEIRTLLMHTPYAVPANAHVTLNHLLQY